MQANVRWMQQHSLPGLMSEVARDIMALASELSIDKFGKLLDQFRLKWSTKQPQYLQYFEATWRDRNPATLWAKCFRNPSLPDGDATLEGHVYFILESAVKALRRLIGIVSN